MIELKVVIVVFLVGFVIAEVVCIKDIVKLYGKLGIANEKIRALKEDVSKQYDEIAYLREQRSLLARDVSITKDQIIRLSEIKIKDVHIPFTDKPITTTEGKKEEAND